MTSNKPPIQPHQQHLYNIHAQTDISSVYSFQQNISSVQQQGKSQNIQLQSQQIQQTLKTLQKLKLIHKQRKLTQLKNKNKKINSIFKNMHSFFFNQSNKISKIKLQHKKLKQTRKKALKLTGIQMKKQQLTQIYNLNDQIKLQNNSIQAQPQSFINKPSYDQLKKRKCYICKTHYSNLHHFYNSLCTSCGDFNYLKRTQSVDLSNLIALVTGARIKIGFQIGLNLLRNGATVIATSRFFDDTYLRYSKQPDFLSWSHRLFILQCDFTSSTQVSQMITKIKQKFNKIDILINNAAQTIVRPKQFYLQQIINQTKSIQNIPQHINQLKPMNRQNTSLPQIYPSLFLPQQRSQFGNLKKLTNSSSSNQLITTFNCQSAFIDHQHRDQFNQPIDKRPKNSWVQKLQQISLIDTYTTQLVNSIVPFHLIAQLKPLMKKSSSQTPSSFIINFSSMQGVFYRNGKQSNHPHTNMAKAALNMITRTSAQQFALDNIYMNSVDTGWVTQQNPYNYFKGQLRLIPLDCLDGAMRVLDPIYSALKDNNLVHGKFIKDYKQSSW